MPAIPCPKCGELLELDDAAAGEPVECGACRHVFTAPESRPSSRRDDDRSARRNSDDNEDYRRRPPRPRRRPARNGTSGMGIASMVCGIIAVLLSCCGSLGLLSVPLGVVAVIVGVLSLKTAGKGFGIAGLVTGALGILMVLAMFALRMGLGIGMI